MTPPEVIVYGTVCLDQFLLSGQEPIELPGGEAFNTATILAGWQIKVALTGTAISIDPEGDRLRELLRTHPLAEGVDSSLVPSIPHAVTPVCTVRVDEYGERFMNGRGFREAVPPPLEPLRPLFASHPIFVVDPNLGEAAIEATLSAHAAGCLVIAMDFPNTPEVLAVSEIAVTSHEWIVRGGKDIDAEVAAKRMVDAGARVAIVTLGAEGGVVCERDLAESWRYPAATPEEPIIDTTGAGDAFRAGLTMMVYLGHKYGLKEVQGATRQIVQFAATVAALHCTQIGGGSRIPVVKIMALTNVTYGKGSPYGFCLPAMRVPH